jgi:hypothetical protein
MNKIIRNILAIVGGLAIGSIVNMTIIMISGSVIPPPDGADVTTMDGLKETMHLFQPKHFIMPFLAHSLGTFVGAMAAGIIAFSHKMKFAFAIGGIFLIGGVINVLILPSPIWYSIVDVVAAYIPMAFIGGKIVVPKKND